MANTYSKEYLIMNKITFYSFLCIVLLFTNSCDRSSKEDSFESLPKEIIIDICKTIIQSPRTSNRAKSLAGKALDGWNNRILDPRPILIYAGYYGDGYDGYVRLTLIMSDEDADIAGISVREVHRQSDGKEQVIQEEYPLFVRSSIGHHQLVKFTKREHEERKDYGSWNTYVQNATWGEDSTPNVWISLPRTTQIDVEIQIYDRAGHKSESVPLEKGVVYKSENGL